MNNLKKAKEKLVKEYIKEINEEANKATELILKKIENKPNKDDIDE